MPRIALGIKIPYNTVCCGYELVLLKNRINKGGYGRTTGHHHKHAKQQQYKHKRKQPKFFALHEEVDEVFKKIHCYLLWNAP